MVRKKQMKVRHHPRPTADMLDSAKLSTKQPKQQVVTWMLNILIMLVDEEHWKQNAYW